MVLPSCCLYVHLYRFEEQFNNSLNNDEKIPDASKNKSINDKLMSPYIPKKKKEEKVRVVVFRDRYFRFITMKWTRIVLIPVFIAIVCVFG
jgi:hypothetical protein